MAYESPQISDYGTLLDLTQAAGVLGSEDGAGKSIGAAVDPIVSVTVGVLP